MQLYVIGTSAGGGVPQWNCSCAGCTQARQADQGKHRRMHASLAVSGAGENWYLVNATPDVRLQIESCPALIPTPSPVRNSPIKGILLTDAELDHTVGLLVLRENASIEVFGPTNVLHALRQSFPVATMLENYSSYKWTEIAPAAPFYIDDRRIQVQSIEVGRKPPKYIRSNSGEKADESAWVLGYRLQDMQSGRSVLVIPQLSAMTDEIMNLAADVDLLFIDGTCSYDDDLDRAGVSKTTSAQMGHLALFADGGIIHGINDINDRRRRRNTAPLDTVLFHINNTNPILLIGSDEAVQAKGASVSLGEEGSKFEL